MFLETTLLSGTTTTLDCIDIDSDTATTLLSTLSTSLTAAPPLEVHHYYHYSSNYINSLSDEQLAKLDSLINEKKLVEEKPKQIVKKF